MPRDLKLRQCLSAFDGVKDVVEVAHDQLGDVVRAYQKNIDKVHSLILFHPASVQMAVNIQKALLEIQGENPGITGEYRNTKVFDRLNTYRSKLEAASYDKKMVYINNMEILSFEILTRYSSDEEGTQGIEAWLSAQIIYTWTAFETMAGNLWEQSLNINPTELTNISKPGGESKKIDIDLIRKYKFDLSNKMGSVIRENNKYHFDSLDGIKQAYKDAFNCQLDNLLSDKCLDVISLVRNNLVHNAGVIDERYLRRKDILPQQLVGEVRSPILLTGETTSLIINPVLKLGVNLMAAVDDWLTAH
jgi:hypothetical protein